MKSVRGYSEPFQTSKMKLFAKMIKGFYRRLHFICVIVYWRYLCGGIKSLKCDRRCRYGLIFVDSSSFQHKNFTSQACWYLIGYENNKFSCDIDSTWITRRRLNFENQWNIEHMWLFWCALISNRCSYLA